LLPPVPDDGALIVVCCGGAVGKEGPMGAWEPPEKPRLSKNEVHEEEPAPVAPVLVGAGSNELAPFNPITNAPELYKYNPTPSATTIIMMNQILALMIN
jgi:hypothetical protein